MLIEPAKAALGLPEKAVLVVADSDTSLVRDVF
jgi:hypothetical protein